MFIISRNVTGECGNVKQMLSAELPRFCPISYSDLTGSVRNHGQRYNMKPLVEPRSKRSTELYISFIF